MWIYFYLFRSLGSFSDCFTFFQCACTFFVKFISNDWIVFDVSVSGIIFKSHFQIVNCQCIEMKLFVF